MFEGWFFSGKIFIANSKISICPTDDLETVSKKPAFVSAHIAGIWPSTLRILANEKPVVNAPRKIKAEIGAFCIL